MKYLLKIVPNSALTELAGSWIEVEKSEQVPRHGNWSEYVKAFARDIPPGMHIVRVELLPSPAICELRATGASRNAGNEYSLTASFNRKPTDDEVRAVHIALRRAPMPCPYCRRPTYIYPCEHEDCDGPSL